MLVNGARRSVLLCRFSPCSDPSTPPSPTCHQIPSPQRAWQRLLQVRQAGENLGTIISKAFPSSASATSTRDPSRLHGALSTLPFGSTPVWNWLGRTCRGYSDPEADSHISSTSTREAPRRARKTKRRKWRSYASCSISATSPLPSSAISNSQCLLQLANLYVVSWGIGEREGEAGTKEILALRDRIGLCYIDRSRAPSSSAET
ncbi:uncharacterized protein LOC109708001 isoform X6 [Ananas comosus]|uniref:Uncharacterized protein LOC109708001 isoform X6 n=1 Tax=Ananas comosus TaxID=4615 RepID=A0A6P5ENY0_ANACO|nr:uncharacterized protein LOC109708001 isoform X6 [Ananas comosus]